VTCSILILSIVKAHFVYTWDEWAEAIRRIYVGINQVLVLKKFFNWRESIDPYLNEAAKTDGVGVCVSVNGILSLHMCAWFCLHALVCCFV